MRVMLLVFLVGCSARAVPPTTSVSVRMIPLSKVKGQMVEEVDDNPYEDETETILPAKPRSTWITGDELERLKHLRETGCEIGDPICSDGNYMSDPKGIGSPP